MIPQFGRRLTRAVLGGFLIGSSLIGLAQEDAAPGVVRITDARPKGVPAQTVGFHGHNLPGQYVEMGGTCPSGDCPSGYGGCPHCQGGHGWGHHCHAKHAHLKALFCEHYGKHSADHGFSIPGKTPIYRRGVQYNSYYPSAWYGTPGGGLTGGQAYPMVYQPTDTTQLGYYYQHVPFWMPNPNVLPQRPIPSQWHNLAPAANVPWAGHGHFGLLGHGHFHGHHHGHWGEAEYCPPAASTWAESSGVMSTPAPVYSQPTLQPTPGTTSPAPATIDPPPAPTPDTAPKNDSAQNLHIRRAALQR